MSKFFFDFQNFNEEIKKKRHTITILNKRIIFESLLKNISINHHKKLQALFTTLINLPLDRIYRNYFSHPLRLTYCLKYFIKTGKTDNYVFSMCHNLKEIGYLDHLVSRGFVSNDVKKKIDILTINRQKQSFSEYLNLFYNMIENFSHELLIFKAFDKLDNLLLFNKAIASEHNIFVVNNYLLPRLKHLNLDLYFYILEFLQFIKKNEKKIYVK